jgi:hypothetical protein
MKQMLRPIAVLAATTLPMTVNAAPGDGVANGCVKAFDDLARKGRPDRFHSVRHKVCACVQQRVKDDPKIDDASKDKVAQVLATMVSDPVKSGEIRRALSKAVNGQMKKHMDYCNK